MKLIQSRDNPLFKELTKLVGSARQRGKVNQTLLDGAHLLSAYLDSGRKPRRILLNAEASRDGEIAALLERAGDVPVCTTGRQIVRGTQRAEDADRRARAGRSAAG